MPIERIECANHDTDDLVIHFHISESQCRDLAAGIVPGFVKAQCLGVLLLEDEDRRKAERPVEKPRRKSA